MIIDLTRLCHEESGVVMEIRGGAGVKRRMEALGIRAGKTITKISSHFWRGPQTVEMNGFQVAIGFGMASKVFVEVERDGSE